MGSVPGLARSPPPEWFDWLRLETVDARHSHGRTARRATPTADGSNLHIDVVDVGTGLAVLVRGPDFALVYDAGSNDDLARGPNNRMLAFMQTAAPTLTTIDHMILSHPHRDHVELLRTSLATYSVRQVWDSGRVNDILAIEPS